MPLAFSKAWGVSFDLLPAGGLPEERCSWGPGSPRPNQGPVGVPRKRGVQLQRFGAGLLVLVLGSCVRLTPYREVRQSLPAERWVELQGQAVYLEQWGNGEPLVLLHGFGGSSYCFRHVGPELGKDFRVVALDLNGFGWTQRVPNPEAYTLAGQARLVLRVMDALGIAKAHVLGHSYGGAVALALAATAPQRVASLVLVAAAVPSPSPRVRRGWTVLRPLGAVLLRTVFLRKGFIRRGLERSVYHRGVVHEAMVEGYLERLKVEGALEAYRAFTAPGAASARNVDLASIHQPTLVLWGMQDRLIPASTGQALAAKLPHGRFLGLERCGHLPMEERPEEFVVAVRSFLKDLVPGDGGVAPQASGRVLR